MTAAIDDLRRIPIFSQLGDETLQRIAERATVSTVSAGHVLIEVGQAAHGLFVLKDGRVAVERPGGSLVELGPGEFVGELALLTERERTARVRTLTESTLLALARDDVRDLIESEPGLAVALLRALADRLSG